MVNEVIISKKKGLEAEDCAVIAQAMSKFKCDVFVIRSNRKINAKSLMGLLSLALKYEDKVYVVCEGNDEIEAYNRISKLL